MSGERGDVLYGETRKLRTPCGSMYVTVNSLNKLPWEVFAKLGKAGGCLSCQVDGLAKLASIALQSGASVERVIDQLIGAQCEKSSVGYSVRSCPDAVGQALKLASQKDKDKGEMK